MMPVAPVHTTASTVTDIPFTIRNADPTSRPILWFHLNVMEQPSAERQTGIFNRQNDRAIATLRNDHHFGTGCEPQCGQAFLHPQATLNGNQLKELPGRGKAKRHQ